MASVADCCKLCAQRLDGNCNYFTYSTGDKTCWMKAMNHNRIADGSVVSGGCHSSPPPPQDPCQNGVCMCVLPPVGSCRVSVFLCHECRGSTRIRSCTKVYVAPHGLPRFVFLCLPVFVCVFHCRRHGSLLVGAHSYLQFPNAAGEPDWQLKGFNKTTPISIQ